MLRTRDLVLFLVTLLFLMLAIMFTVGPSESAPEINEVLFKDGEEMSANYEAAEIDRKSVIARLREAISGAETISAPESEVVAVVVDEVVSNLLECGDLTEAISLAKNWPTSGVIVTAVEGVRLVAKLEQVEVLPAVVDASSTEVLVEPVYEQKYVPLLSLPILPIKNTEPVCPQNEVVGVTATGDLIFNSDAIVYQTKRSNELIGYARDGFPIYGPYSGETDACGGYEAAGLYRYAVNPNTNKVLNCYSGMPSNFSSE